MKTIKEVYCHYDRDWIPLGRARARCPSCGAVMDRGPYSRSTGGTHPVREREEQDGGRVMSRFCGKCPTSRMPDHVCHLHELEPGSLFVSRGGSEVHELVRVGLLQCTIRPAQGAAPRERVAFEADGEPVEFTRKRAATRPVAPGMMVELVPAPHGAGSGQRRAP